LGTSRSVSANPRSRRRPGNSPTAPGQYFFTVTALDSVSGFSTTRGYTLNIYPNGQVPPLSLGVGPNLGIFSLGNFIQTQLIPTGGTPPYTYSYTPGASPIPGVRVQTGGPFPTGFASNTTGGLLGLVATTGTFNSSIRIADATGSTFDRAVTMTVSPMTILSTNTMPKATVNVPYSFQFNGFGGTGNYSWSATGLPAGTLAFSATTPGLLTGTPTASGPFNPQITITDLSNSTSLPFGFTLTVNPFSINNNAVLTQGVVGVPYNSTTLTASNGNCGSSCAWTVSSGSLPVFL
jgi:large repetitive protein